jgi:hypothetical protein
MKILTPNYKLQAPIPAGVCGCRRNRAVSAITPAPLKNETRLPTQMDWLCTHACVLSCTTPTILPNVDCPIAEQTVRTTKVATTENIETHALSSTGDLSPGYCTFLLSLDQEVVGREARRAASSGSSKGRAFHRLVASVADSPQLDRRRTAQSSDSSSTAKIRGVDRAGPNVSQ